MSLSCKYFFAMRHAVTRPLQEAIMPVMSGVPLVAQLGFAGYLHGVPRKKPVLMTGIHLRVAALAGAAVTIGLAREAGTMVVIGLLYLWMLLFSLSGAFAGIAYTDILGRVVRRPDRKSVV